MLKQKEIQPQLPTKYPYQFSIKTHESTGCDYLDIFGFDNINENLNDQKYLIQIDCNDQDGLNKLLKRYTAPKKIPGLGQGINIFTLNRLQMDSHKSYKSPNKSDGWFNVTKFAGFLQNVNEIGNFENNLVFHPSINSPFLKQATAFYNTDKEMMTAIETKYSASIVEFNFVKNKNNDIMIFVDFYYKGENKSDVPIDIQMCIDDFGKFDVEFTDSDKSSHSSESSCHSETEK